MSKHVRVDAVELHRSSGRVLDHVDTSRVAHSGHDDDLVDAAGRWNGEIASALAHVANSWAAKRGALHQDLGRIGQAMSDGAIEYATTDHDAADAITKQTESL